MFGTTDLALFVISGLLLNITPGPDTLYIVGRSGSQGWRAGAVAALGIGAGLIVHTIAVTVGIAALLAASATAFIVVKWIGAAYLIYIGVSLWLVRPTIDQQALPLQAMPLRAVFVQGFLTNVLNPKVALFFVAFLPQFVDPDAPNKALVFLFLGFVFNFNGTLWNLFVAWSAAHLTRALDRSGSFVAWLNRAIGALFVYIGVRLALSHELS